MIKELILAEWLLSIKETSCICLEREYEEEFIVYRGAQYLISGDSRIDNWSSVWKQLNTLGTFF